LIHFEKLKNQIIGMWKLRVEQTTVAVILKEWDKIIKFAASDATGKTG